MITARACRAARDNRGLPTPIMVGPSASGLALAGVAHHRFSPDRSLVASSSVDGMENSDERFQILGYALQERGFLLHAGNGGSYVH